jgi:hypothetical protein
MIKRIYKLAFALFAALPLIFLTACMNDANDLPLVLETSHARFYSPNHDAEDAASSLADAFEANHDRLAELFQYEAGDRTIIHLYTDKDEFREMIGRDTEGTYDAQDRIIKVYTPADISDETTRHNFKEQIVHEFVHQIIQQINPDVATVQWLDEGTAYYASGQLEEEMQVKTFYYDIPTIEQFADPEYFDKAGGAAYFYSGLMVQYIADTYGVDALNRIIRHPDHTAVERILDQSIAELHEAWHSAMINNGTGTIRLGPAR